MAIQIGNQGTITASTRITVDSAKQSQVQSYSFSVSPDGNACDFPSFAVTVYSSSPVLGIGSTLFTDINLTTPTTYSSISNPNDPNNTNFTITGNTITCTSFCD